MEIAAHSAGRDSIEAWDGLDVVYLKRPGALAELTVLENTSASDLIRFLASDGETSKRVIAGVIERGGLYDFNGKWVEVTL